MGNKLINNLTLIILMSRSIKGDHEDQITNSAYGLTFVENLLGVKLIKFNFPIFINHINNT